MMTPAEWAASDDPEPMLRLVLPTATDRKRRLFSCACCRSVEGWLLEKCEYPRRRDDYRNALDAAEQFADGRLSADGLLWACMCADDSTFCNHDLTDVTDDEVRQAQFGDDTLWPARWRANLARPGVPNEADFPDFAAWVAATADHGLACGVDPFRDVAGRDDAEIGETVWRKVLLLVRNYAGRDREAEERVAHAALIRDIFGDPFPPTPFDADRWPSDVIGLANAVYATRAWEQLPALADALEEARCHDTAVLAHCRNPGLHARGCWVVDAILGKS